MEIITHGSKKILADLHTHTLASQHALSTVKENLQSGARHKLKYVAITDHFMNSDDEMARKNELSRIYVLNHISNNSTSTNLIPGIETTVGQDILRKHASDIEDDTTFRLVGIHKWWIFPDLICEIKKVPELFQESITSPQQITPTAFAHIERELYLFTNSTTENIKRTLEDIVDVAVANDVFLEINSASLKYNPDNFELMKYWINYAISRGAKFCFGSDAHYCDDVGDFSSIKFFIDVLNLSGLYVLNYDNDALGKLFRR